jgi:hypothetical protein
MTALAAPCVIAVQSLKKRRMAKPMKKPMAKPTLRNVSAFLTVATSRERMPPILLGSCLNQLTTLETKSLTLPTKELMS